MKRFESKIMYTLHYKEGYMKGQTAGFLFMIAVEI